MKFIKEIKVAGSREVIASDIVCVVLKIQGNITIKENVIIQRI